MTIYLIPPLHQYILTILLACLPAFVVATELDDLVVALEAAKPGSIDQAEALTELASYYRYREPEKSILYATQLLEMAQSQGLDEYIFDGHMAIGVGYAISSADFEEALTHFIQAHEVAKRNSGEGWQASTMKVEMNIAGVHMTRDEPQKAMPYAHSYVSKLEQTKDTATLADAYLSLGILHESGSTVDSVFHYLNKAENLYRRLGDALGLMNVTLHRGRAYNKKGNYEQALTHLFRLAEEASMHQDTGVLIATLPHLSEAYLELGQIRAAQEVGYRALALSKKRGILQSELEANLAMQEIFQRAGQFDSAYTYLKSYSDIREAIADSEQIKAMEKMEARFQIKRKSDENKQLQSIVKEEQSKNRLLVLCSVLFLLLLLAVIFFYRRLSYKNEELETLNQTVFNTNARLSTLMSEKKHLVSLIAHDIRNPLSLIQFNTYSLANQTSSASQQQMLTEIEQAASSIDQASAKIMEVEQKSEESVTIRSESFLLAPALRETEREFLAYASRKGIQLRVEQPDADQSVKADPFLFRHAVANLVSNALKYSSTGSIVKVWTEQHSRLTAIHVEDQGPGLSTADRSILFEQGKTGSSQPTAGETSSGEGLYLTRRYVEAMGGRIQVDSELGKGTTFTMIFPR